MKARDYFVIVVLIGFGAFAAWKGLEVLASISVIGIVVVTYKYQFLMARDLLITIARSARQAKVGAVEVQLGDKIIDRHKFSSLSIKKQVLLTSLNSQEVGLLAEISNFDSYPTAESMHFKLRNLRDLGLIVPDTERLGGSTCVMLTATGRELVEEINRVHSIE